MCTKLLMNTVKRDIPVALMRRWRLFSISPIPRVGFCASSLKQQSADRHVVSLGHIIQISRRPVFGLYLFSGEAANTNFVFCLTGKEHNLSHSRPAQLSIDD